jgi:hypothetical protein
LPSAAASIRYNFQVRVASRYVKRKYVFSLKEALSLASCRRCDCHYRRSRSFSCSFLEARHGPPTKTKCLLPPETIADRNRTMELGR